MTEYNILIDLLPTSVEVGGRSFDINTDFRTGILLEQLFADREYSQQDKLSMAITLYFGNQLVDDLRDAIDQIQWFYSVGKEKFAATENEVSDRRSKIRKPERVLDYDIDAPLIYSSFLTQYGLDLQDVESLHWWKFHAMLHGLKDDLPLSRIMLYRGIDLNTIKDTKLRKQYASLKAKYKLPSLLDAQERISLAGHIFATRGIVR